MPISSFYAEGGPSDSELELVAWYLAEITRIYNDALSLNTDISAILADAEAAATAAAGSATAAANSATEASDFYDLAVALFNYTPLTLSDWTGSVDPGNIADALDQLGSRVTDLEGAGGGGGATNLNGLTDVTLTAPAISDVLKYTGTEWANEPLTSVEVPHTAGVLADWTGGTSPPDVSAGLDQLALRVTDLEAVPNPTESIVVACSDESTALTTGTSKVTFRMPYAFTLTAVRASLSTAQTSGSIFTVDINEGGTTILSTKLTIDNTEKTSTTAATAAVISDSSLSDDAEITVDIDQVGDGTAKGLKVVLIGRRT